MKIAVAADTNNTDASVSMHAARAPYYLLYDEKGKLLDVIRNPFSGVERGAAPGAAELLVTQGVNTLVAGECGGRFTELLANHNITLVIAQGTAANAVSNAICKQ